MYITIVDINVTSRFDEIKLVEYIAETMSELVAKLFPEYITSNPDVPPNFSNPKHVRSTKELLENSFTRDAKLYQILHTYLLLAEKYKIAI